MTSSNKRMYILVNKNVEMTAGKAGAQIGHVVTNYIHKYGIDEEWYCDGLAQAKVILSCSQGLLTYLQEQGYYCVVDNTLQVLTACCVGIYTKENFEKLNKKFKRLQVYK